MSWYNVYCIFVALLAVVIGLMLKEFDLFNVGNASLAFVVVYSIFAFFVITGVTARKLWAWRLNFSLLLLPVIYLVCLMLFETIGSSGAVAKNNSTEVLKLIAVVAIYLAVWVLPNQIYFFRRKNDFLYNDGDLEVADVYGITLAIIIPLLSLLVTFGVW